MIHCKQTAQINNVFCYLKLLFEIISLGQGPGCVINQIAQIRMHSLWNGSSQQGFNLFILYCNVSQAKHSHPFYTTDMLPWAETADGSPGNGSKG